MRLATIRTVLRGRLRVRAPANYADPVLALDQPDLTGLPASSGDV